MGAFMLAYPAVDFQQIDVFNIIDFVVFPDNLEEGVPHFPYQVVPDNDKFLIQEMVFEQHFEFEQNGFWGVEGIGKDDVVFIPFQLCPAIGIPYVRGQVIYFLFPKV